MQVPTIKVRAAGTHHRLRVLHTAFIVFAVLLVSMLFGAGQLWAQCGSLSAPSTTWQNGGNSFWDLSGNWTSGTPTASTNACILNGTSTVTLNTKGKANGLQLATGNTLDITAVGSLSLLGSSFNFGTLNNSGSFSNKGTINGTDFLTNLGSINNSGTFRNSGTINTGDFTNTGSIMNSGTLNQGGLFSTASGNLTNNGSITNTGTIFTNENSLLNNFGIINNRNLITTFAFSVINNSGILNNTGTILIGDGSSVLTNAGTLNNSGTITAGLANTGTLNNKGTYNNVFGGGNTGVINNTGTFSNDGGVNSGAINNSGTINNSAFENTGSITNQGRFNVTGTFDNSGSFTTSGRVTVSNAGVFTTSTDYTQTGGRTIVNGTLTATSGAIVDIEGGKLSGTGTINGDVLMKGMMSPGSGGVPGTFTVNGNYQQTATGVFDEIIKGASSNGVLDVTGLLALDPGSLLKITLEGGFDPVGDSFTILDYGSLSGEFGNGTSFMADGYNWTLTYGPGDAILTAVSGDPVNTPEPGTIALLAFGLPLLGYAAKRRSPAGRNS
jgi:hypothetical protein